MTIDYYWLILSHNIEKNYGVCDECREENINISEHKCSYDFIIKKFLKVLIKMKI